MAFQVNDAVLLAKRAGLLGGLLGGDDDDDASESSSAATAKATNGGLLGGLQDGLGSVGAGISSGLSGVTSALGGLAPTPSTTTTTSSSSSSAAATSSVASTTSSATVASSTSASSSSLSSALTSSSSVPLSSAPLSSSSSTEIASTTPSAVSSAPSSTITAAPSIWVTTEGSGQAVTITSHITAQQAVATNSAVPAPQGFLQNKGAVAGTFTVVGLIVLVLLFIASTWCIRRNKRNRLLEEAVDWSPQTHLGGGALAQDTEKGYPNALYRTNSGSSNNSRSTAQRYAAPSTYRDQPQPPLPSQMYNAGPSAGNAYGGYYDKPVPAAPAPGSQYAGSQYAPSIAPSQRQQGYGQPAYGQYPAYQQPAPPPSLQPAQNPFNPNANVALAAPQFDRSHARTPSPTDSDMAYLGYVDAPGNGVQLGRKISLTKATATTVQHQGGSAEGMSTDSHGTMLKVVNE